MTDYVVAIASHARKNILEQRTIALLTKHKINMNIVYVFVSDTSYDNYIDLQKKYNFNLMKGNNNSILETRNNIIQYFEEGQPIIEIDDDITDIVILNKHKPTESLENLDELFLECFAMLPGQGLFGFCAQANSFFSNCTDQFGLYSIINSCLGYYNDKRIVLTVKEKEDYERTCIFYTMNLPILKRSGFGIKTKYWSTKGGIQSHYSFNKRIEVQRQSALQLKQKFPKLCYTYTRPNKIMDIRFYRDPLKKSYLNLIS